MSCRTATWSCSGSMSERRTVLITGASRGIGAETARLFAKHGYAVGVNYCHSRRRAEVLADQLRALGVPVGLYAADVSNKAQVDRMVTEFLADFGHIDALVCNAGIARQGLFSDITEASWREMMGVDLDGVFYCCQAVLPDMLHRKAGRIVTLSSMWGQVGASCEVAYSAAKAGVIGLTKALAKELGPSGVTVNCVAPGIIETEMNGRLSQADKDALAEETPLERLGTALDVARAVWFLASEEGGFFTGQVLAPNGGFVI